MSIHSHTAKPPQVGLSHYSDLLHDTFMFISETFISTVHFRIPFYGLYSVGTQTIKEAHSHRMIQVGNANRLTIHTGKCAVSITAHLASSRIVAIKEIWRFYLDRILLEDTFSLQTKIFSVTFQICFVSCFVERL